MRAHWWFIRTFGFRNYVSYERERRRRRRVYGPFLASRDGEPLLRALGCGEKGLQRARERGLA